MRGHKDLDEVHLCLVVVGWHLIVATLSCRWAIWEPSQEAAAALQPVSGRACAVIHHSRPRASPACSPGYAHAASKARDF